VDGLLEVLRGREDAITLDRAALELATIEYPGLRPEPYLELLDSYAAELHRRVSGDADGLAFVIAANEYLFFELGFVGNTASYYDAANSCLNYVLTARVGIPITLSLVYMEVARRLGRPVEGIGMPGHFLVRYDDGKYATYLDAFHGGRPLREEECFELARQVAGADVPQDPRLLEPVTKRQILVRMLANLRGVYLMREAYGKAVAVLNLLTAAHPGEATEYEREARELKRYLARMN
jgi:regulator of sirC expression with transglutaminase-like and TPR domain